MIFRFVSDDDWHSLFHEKREGVSDATTDCALSSGFVRRCSSEDPRALIHSIKVVHRRFQKIYSSGTHSKAANNGN